jgi:hypothetical protein
MVILLLVVLCALPLFAADPPKNDCAQPPLCAGSTCQLSIGAGSAMIPTEPCPRFGSNQEDVDVFSWNEFIAYNWPAAKSCVADTSKSILQVKSGSNGPLLWQSQMSTDDLFNGPGGKPAAWCKAPALFMASPRAFHHIAKAPPAARLLGAAFEKVAEPSSPLQAKGGVLTDQSGRWVRYEKLVNQTEYQYIVSNNLWNQTGLKGKTVTFPVGSTEFKASWKVLTPAEAASGRYYTTSATVFNTPAGNDKVGPNPVTLGLVGLHIVHKTDKFFFWSTFEHVDNDKVFFNPKSNAAPNTQTAKTPFVELDPNTKQPTAPGVNVVRLTPIQASSAINSYYRGLLNGSVFANYQLITTQWQFNLNTGGAPQYAANITMETYVQRESRPNPTTPTKQPFTGCLFCHAFSKWDQSFVFLEAH